MWDILFDFNPKPQGPQKVVSANECNCFMIFMLRATRNPCTVDRLYILTISVQWKIDAGPSDASAAADGGGSAAEGPMAASASASKIPRLQDSKILNLNQN